MSELPSLSARSLGWPARLGLAFVALLVFFGGLGSIPLLEPDEGRYTEIPREMLLRGDFVTPRLNGVLYFEKPPLYYWLNAGALAVLGRPELACRLAGAFFGLAGLGLAYALGRSMGSRGSRGTGLLAAVFLGTSPLYLGLSRAAIIDMTLSFFLGATLTCAWLALAREGGRGARLLWYGAFAAAALATLAKGLIGFVIPGAVMFFFLLFTRRWSVLRRVPWGGGILLFLAIAVPWHVLAAQRNPDFLWFYFIHEHVLRYATPVAQRQEPFWFFIPVLLFGLLPWSGLLPAAALQLRRGSLRQRPELVFLTVWAGFVFLFFSASQSKLVPYVLPACLPLAVLLALTLDPSRLEDGRTRSWSRAGALVAAVVLAALALAFLWVAFGRVPIYSPAFSPRLFAFALPAFTAAVVAMIFWRSPAAGVGPRVSALALAALLFFGCIWAVGPRVGLARSTKDFARDLAARLQPGDEVYAYRCYPQTLPVYLGRLISLVSHDGELNFGIAHLSPEERVRRFPRMAEFRPVWRSDRLVYLVLEAHDLPRMPGDGLAPGPILMRSEKYLLMINRPAGSRPTPETP